MNPPASAALKKIIIGALGLLFAIAWLRIAVSVSSWPEASVAKTMLGEWLFLQESSIAVTFSGLELLSFAVAGLILSPVWKLRGVRVAIAVSVLAYPAIMIGLYLTRTAPAA